jgi:hypothetical protein
MFSDHLVQKLVLFLLHFYFFLKKFLHDFIVSFVDFEFGKSEFVNALDKFLRIRV